MISIDNAIKIVSSQTLPIGIQKVDLFAAIDRVLAEDLIADMDLPPFDRSQMDGFALKAADTIHSPVKLRIIGESSAGNVFNGTLLKGEAVRIMTGAALPKGADAVQKLEFAKEHNSLVEILEPTSKGRFIVKKGEEIRKGKTALSKGSIINAENISVPAAFGYSKINVSKRPRVAIISTGNEIVDTAKRPKIGQIRNSNSIMLFALAKKAGADVNVLPLVGDDLSSLTKAVRKAIRSSDIVITTGGVSVGKYDLTKQAIIDAGSEIFFEKVRLKPGKPSVFAKCGKTLIFGLPGNPVSAAVSFQLFVRLAIKIMQSASATSSRREIAVTLSIVKAPATRDALIPASVSTNKSGQLIARPTRWIGSSDLVGASSADCLIFIPKGKTVDKGETATIFML